MILSSKKKIFVVQPVFDLNAPRCIRIRNIFKYLTAEFNVQILKFKHPNKTQELPDAIFHSLELSTFNSTFVNNNFSSEKYISSKSIISRLIRKIHQDYINFPDTWSSTHSQIINYFSSNKISDVDYIYVSIFPFSNAQLAHSLRQIPGFREAKVILDIGDPLTYNAARLEEVSNLKRNYESKYLSASDKIIVTNQLTKDHYLKDFNIDNNKISVIPQGVDTSLFVCDKLNFLVGDKIKLCYAGIFYEKLRSPNNFFTAVKKIEQEPELEIALFGSNRKYQNRNVTVHEKISQKQLVQVYNESHVLLFFDNAFGLQLSGKIFELIATRKPILFIYSNPESEALKLVNKYPHIFKTRNTVEDITDALKKLPDVLQSSEHLDYNVQDLSWENRALGFKNILHSLN